MPTQPASRLKRKKKGFKDRQQRSGNKSNSRGRYNTICIRAQTRFVWANKEREKQREKQRKHSPFFCCFCPNIEDQTNYGSQSMHLHLHLHLALALVHTCTCTCTCTQQSTLTLSPPRKCKASHRLHPLVSFLPFFLPQVPPCRMSDFNLEQWRPFSVANELFVGRRFRIGGLLDSVRRRLETLLGRCV